jgi:LPXTG-motif cell wall-anchored protein
LENSLKSTSASQSSLPIIIGVIAGGFVLLGVAAFLVWRRKQTKNLSLVSVVEPLAQYAANPLFVLNASGQDLQSSWLHTPSADDNLFNKDSSRVDSIFYPVGGRLELRSHRSNNQLDYAFPVAAEPDDGNNAAGQTSGQIDILFNQRPMLMDQADSDLDV